MALFLTENDVDSLLTMDAAIEALEDGFRHQAAGTASNSPRRRIRMGGGMLHFMAAADRSTGVTGMKWYGGFGGGMRFHVQLSDSETGELLAVMEAGRLGQVRTGAASGVATKYMARPDARNVGIIGSGYQAETQLEAICRVRTVDRVRVFSRTPERRSAFAGRSTASLGIEVTAVDSAEECVEGADIVAVITSATSPVLKGEWLPEGAHINAAGVNHWLRRELDGEAVARANVIIADDVEQARIECADLIHPVERGELTWQRVRELWEVVSGTVAGRTSPDDITLFESQGIALEDIAAGFHVYRLARERGVGTEVP